MYPVKLIRRRQALRLAAIAAVLGFSSDLTSPVLADNIFIGFNNSSWTATNGTIWSGGVPSTLQTVDLFKTATVIYTLSSAVDYAAVQISAANSSAGNYSLLLLQSGTNLETTNLDLGSGATSNTGGGAGEISQSGGIVIMDAGGTVAIDSTSIYALSGSGFLNAYTEQFAGTFSQTGGSNGLASGFTLTNTGSYVIYNSSKLNADNIVNSGIFNQSTGSAVGGTTALTTSFTNNGTYLYSGGTFTGFLTNNPGGLVSISVAAIPFSQGILDNGQLNVNSTGFNASSGTYPGPISGNGNILFSGTGITTLTGSNAFSGSTGITNGTLVLAGPVGTAGNNFGASLAGTISVGSAGTLQTTVASQIANNALLNVNGGTVNLEGQDQTVGSLTMTGGQIQTTGVGLGVATGSVTLTRNSAAITGGLRSSSNFSFNVSNNATLAVAGVISGYNATTGLMLTGGGTLSIYGSSQLSTIDIQQGILQIAEGGTFNSSNVTTTVESNGTLNLNSQILTIGDLLGSGTVSIGTGSLTVVSTAGSSFGGTIYGSGSLIKSGTGTLVLTGTDASSGTTTANTGVLTLASYASLSGSLITANAGATINLNGTLTNTPAIAASGTVNFGANPGTGYLQRVIGTLSITGGQVNIPFAATTANRTLLIPSSISFSGATNAWTGQLDLANNDMDITNGNLATLTNQVKSGLNLAHGGNWNGTGIASSAAAADTTHLTALGVILNDNGQGTPLYGFGGALGQFDGTNPSDGDVLIKYTYVGDANLDGKVDGSDYSRIDNGFLNTLTGWYNGDFNYDGVVNGSDYTLIDNAFNTQGAAILNDIAAASTAQLAATTSVPEPGSLALLAVSAAGLLVRRRGGSRIENRG
jgi:fibronectin-binding autotransporter adhesin